MKRWSSAKLGLGALLSFSFVGTLAASDIPLRNWAVPETLRKAVDATSPRSFIGLPPCRIVDTRGNAAPIQGGIYAPGEERSYVLTGICGLPVGADAVSLNITVTQTGGAGFVSVWTDGTPMPTVSTQNFLAGETIANAAIVPLSGGGAIRVVAGGAGMHLIIDINGYFSDLLGTPGNFFQLTTDSAGFTMFLQNLSLTCGGPCGLYQSTSSNSTNQAIFGQALGTGAGTGVYGITNGNSSGAGVFGTNSASNGAPGVWGNIDDNVGSSPAVKGTHTATGLLGIGGDFSHAGSGWGVRGRALGATGIGSKGVYGTSASNTDNSLGVHGQALASSGRIYGVRGDTNSSATGAAGVLGIDGTGATARLTGAISAGVRGESLNFIGTYGVSMLYGVAGTLTNAGGGVVQEGFLGYEGGATDYAVFGIGNFGGTGAKYFVEPHPERADMVIRYIALEGPESGTYFRGRGKFQNGLASIEVPEDFRMVSDTEGLSIQVTPIGEMATVAVMRIGLDRIVVKGSRNVEFFYTVNGIRKTHRHLRPVGQGREFMPESADATMPEYLTEGQKQMLVSNGTYTAEGKVNHETAKALGWDQVWEERTKGKKTESSTTAGQQTQE